MQGRWVCLATISLNPLFAQSPVGSEVYRQMDAAYTAQRQGDLRGALARVEAALALDPGNAQARQLKLQLLLDSGRTAEGEVWLRTLLREHPTEGSLLLQQAMLAARLQRYSEAIAAAHGALADPSLRPEDRRLAQLTLADLLLADHQYSQAASLLTPYASDTSPDIQNRLGYALLGTGTPEPATRAFSKALETSATDAERRSAASGLRDAAHRANKPELEVRALQTLRSLSPTDPSLAQDLGYTLTRLGRDREAHAAFLAAQTQEGSATGWLDAAYAARRSGLNQEAVRDFGQALDALHKSPAPDPRQTFGIRREAENLSRTWGAVLGSSYQGGFLPGLSATQRVAQQGLEIYYQPEALTQNGRMVQVFVQGFETLWTAGQGPRGGRTLQTTWGVRAKPLATQNLVLTLQRLFPGGELATTDWLLRAGYSADTGQDLRPWSTRWTTGTVYTEGASYLGSGRYIQSLEARLGESWRGGESFPRLVVTPHLVLGGDYDSRTTQTTAIGVGAGLSLRQWFRESPHTAPASWADFSLQYRAKLTQAARAEGFFVRLTIWL
nr:tetratricopeptide repeat protein [uncultured Holophaga sp.]